MQLYTSLERLKRAMNGGTLPPLTPRDSTGSAIVQSWRGGLDADPVTTRLRCPFFGCGRGFDNLGLHVAAAHKGSGGVAALRRELGIPASTPLLSERFRADLTERVLAIGHEHRRRFDSASGRRASLARRHFHGPSTSVNARNLGDCCEVQLSHRIVDLSNKLGRSPTETEFRYEYGDTIMSAVVATFGSWSAAKEACGLRVFTRKRLVDSSTVLPALSAWHRAHGTLPSSKDAIRPNKTPYLPHYRTVLRAMAAPSWPEAMYRAAAALNIYGGRYGLPESARQAAVGA